MKKGRNAEQSKISHRTAFRCFHLHDGDLRLVSRENWSEWRADDAGAGNGTISDSQICPSDGNEEGVPFGQANHAQTSSAGHRASGRPVKLNSRRENQPEELQSPNAKGTGPSFRPTVSRLDESSRRKMDRSPDFAVLLENQRGNLNVTQRLANIRGNCRLEGIRVTSKWEIRDHSHAPQF
jgi:hypothetical protein